MHGKAKLVKGNDDDDDSTFDLYNWVSWPMNLMLTWFLEDFERM